MISISYLYYAHHHLCSGFFAHIFDDSFKLVHVVLVFVWHNRLQSLIHTTNQPSPMDFSPKISFQYETVISSGHKYVINFKFGLSMRNIVHHGEKRTKVHNLSAECISTL